MREYLDIELASKSVERRSLEGRELALAGRYWIAKSLLEEGCAQVDPLGPDNPLIFSAGPFAGTNFSNANRLSVGCRSPLTGGIKESNAGGTFALAMGHLQIAGFTLRGAAESALGKTPAWVFLCDPFSFVSFGPKSRKLSGALRWGDGALAETLPHPVQEVRGPGRAAVQDAPALEEE